MINTMTYYSTKKAGVAAAIPAINFRYPRGKLFAPILFKRLVDNPRHFFRR
jgi:hypothetical protein